MSITKPSEASPCDRERPVTAKPRSPNAFARAAPTPPELPITIARRGSCALSGDEAMLRFATITAKGHRRLCQRVIHVANFVTFGMAAAGRDSDFLPSLNLESSRCVHI
jgi:hypothetical protein